MQVQFSDYSDEWITLPYPVYLEYGPCSYAENLQHQLNDEILSPSIFKTYGVAGKGKEISNPYKLYTNAIYDEIDEDRV